MSPVLQDLVTFELEIRIGPACHCGWSCGRGGGGRGARRNAQGSRGLLTCVNFKNHLQNWYKTRNRGESRIQGKLTIDRIKTSGGWPKLKAKAAATRHLATFALFLCRKYHNGSGLDDRMQAVCELLVRFFKF